MSVLVSILGENYSIIATDDRATYNSPCNGAKWRDGVNKLFIAPFGFVAAHGGISGVKDYFIDYLSKYQIKTRQDVWALFCYASQDCKEYLQAVCHEKSFDIRKTSASTFVYSLNYFDDGTAYMGIEMIDFLFGIRRLKEKNTLIIRAPKNTKRIRRLKEKYSELARDVKDMHEALYIVACLIDEMSKVTKFISNNVHCGISYKLSENSVFFLGVVENAKVIKQLYKENRSLSNIMRVVGGIKNEHKASEKDNKRPMR